jgi:hypothetical protein
LVDSVLARKRAFHSNLAAHTTASLAPLGFAAPMVGAPPDNIRAQRLAEGGVPASGAGSAQGGSAINLAGNHENQPKRIGI